MTVLAHISDTHFGTEQTAVVDALARWVHAQAPDVLVLSGDVTQRATKAQFAAARAFCDRLHVPQLLVIPGNHDIPLFALWERALNPYGRYRRAFGPVLDPVIEREDCLVLGLKTTRRWRHENGAVSAQQCAASAQRLTQAAPHKLRIVVVHQPVAVYQTQDHRNLLQGHARAIEQWAAAGADLILGGHIHLPYALQLPTARTCWAVQAGTAVSSRVRDDVPNSVNLLRGPQLARDGSRSCTLERWDYDAQAHAFAPVQCRTLALSPAAYSHDDLTGSHGD